MLHPRLASEEAMNDHEEVWWALFILFWVLMILIVLFH